jgi:F-type H+-transporting ATPase subunit gamma
LSASLDAAGNSQRKRSAALLTGVVVAISVTSDRGLAGAFNSTILRLTENYMREMQAKGVQVDLITVGKKALSCTGACSRSRSTATYLGQADFRGCVDRQSRDPRLLEAEIDEVCVIFHRFVNVADQSPENHRLCRLRPRS